VEDGVRLHLVLGAAQDVLIGQQMRIVSLIQQLAFLEGHLFYTLCLLVEQDERDFVHDRMLLHALQGQDVEVVGGEFAHGLLGESHRVVEVVLFGQHQGAVEYEVDVHLGVVFARSDEEDFFGVSGLQEKVVETADFVQLELIVAQVPLPSLENAEHQIGHPMHALHIVSKHPAFGNPGNIQLQFALVDRHADMMVEM